MKNYMISILIAIFISACNQNKDFYTVLEINKSLDKDKEMIMNTFNDIVICWNNEDIECYMKAYSTKDTVQMISKNGVTFGYENILRQFKKSFPKRDMGKLSFENYHYRKLAEDLFFVTGKFNLTFKDSKEPFSNWFSVIMKRYNNKYLIITDHS
ncbi:hypothetical protein [Winogradskyella haliclonae]|uniref:DUF4440 domain-containing protein n=1 Tax=Winogradskyella haliclonae TaxID=2048558 RepID=A0ABQ2C1E8_9FLAO|nr:hypothetical protein [Winogradskyella haliclonae]GGI57588.1 hypothetical protein GCM10011444_18970 [Winogradskyella haliclonae]